MAYMPLRMKKDSPREEKAERKAGVKDSKAEEAKEVKNPKAKTAKVAIVFGKKGKK